MYEIDAPRTRASLAEDLAGLGIAAGETLLVHASLRSVGWTAGGGVALAQAFLDVLGPAGTLLVPTHTGVYSDPAGWSNPPVPESWWPVIREHMPAFDPRITPSYKIGALAETVRALPGALRSAHPQVSFAAVGPQATVLTGSHTLDDSLGEGSPLARLEELGGRVLLLGVGFDTNTIFHLAEYRYGRAPRVTEGAAIEVEGHRRWATYDDVDLDSGDFPQLGAALVATGVVREGRVGSAACKLFSAREAASFATEWLRRHRA